MNKFMVDKDLCIKCGMCVKDCPSSVIEMNEYPVLEKKGCLKCGHCLTVCPTGAISILGYTPEESTLLEGSFPSAQQMKMLIKGRRSVRQYHDKDVDPNTIKELLDIASHAPTGANMRAVQFIVIDNKKTMDAFRNDVYAELATVLPKEIPKGDHVLELLSLAVKDRAENGSDIIFRGAPHLVITIAPKATACPVADTHIALAYFELMAQAMELGTVWSGIFLWVLARIPDITTRLGIPEDHLIGYAMAFGLPVVKYQRTVERGSANIKSVSWR